MTDLTNDTEKIGLGWSALNDGLGGIVWVCPWSICTHDEAQKCRAEKSELKRRRGCGTYFSQNITPEQAKALISRIVPPNG